MALAAGPAVTTDEQGQWSQLAGENAANPPPLTATKRAEITRELHPGGFDQVPLPARMTVPGIWVYGRRAVPTRPRRAPRRCSACTRRRGKDFTVVLFPHAGHGLLDVPPTDPRAMPTLLAWIHKHVRAS